MFKEIWKSMLVVLGLVVMFSLCVNALFDSMKDGVNDISDKYKAHLGDKVVINKDTLIIIDYSLIESNYKLSNGSEVSFDYVDKISTNGK